MAAAKKDDRTDLQRAVEALEHELLQLSRLTEQALRHPLNSEKHLQQTASSLQQIGAMEPQLAATMRQLTAALAQLGQIQQDRIEKASARATELKARHDVFAGLLERARGLGGVVGEVQELLSGDSTEAIAAVVDKVAKLVADAEALEQAAVDADFVDVARDVKSLRQQLSSAHASIAKRLEKLTSVH